MLKHDEKQMNRTPPSHFELTESILSNKCNSRIGIEPSERPLIFGFI